MSGWAVIAAAAGAADLLAADPAGRLVHAGYDAAGRRWERRPAWDRLRDVPGGWRDRHGETILPEPPADLDHRSRAPGPPVHRGHLLLDGVDAFDPAALIAAAPDAVWQAWLSAGTGDPGRWYGRSPQTGLLEGRHIAGAVDRDDLAARSGRGPVDALRAVWWRPEESADLPGLGGRPDAGIGWPWWSESMELLGEAQSLGLHTGPRWRVLLAADRPGPLPPAVRLTTVRGLDLPAAAAAAAGDLLAAGTGFSVIGALLGQERRWRTPPGTGRCWPAAEHPALADCAAALHASRAEDGRAAAAPAADDPLLADPGLLPEDAAARMGR